MSTLKTEENGQIIVELPTNSGSTLFEDITREGLTQIVNLFPETWIFLMGLFGGHAWVLILTVFMTLTFIVDLSFRKFIYYLNKYFDDKEKLFLKTISIASKTPVSFYIWLSASALALNTVILTFPYFNDLITYVSATKSSLALISVAWFAIRWVNQIETYVKSLEEDSRWDPVSMEAMVKIFKLTVFIITSLFVLSSFGINLTALLAFGGMGGIAVGFAAKDLLGNFIGGFIIYMDKPFKVGDWIRSPDKNIEGTVENIGWRVTKVRTFDKRPLYIPNGTFSVISIENPSRMLNRRIKEIVGVRYDDIKQVANITGAIKQMLITHQDIDANQTIIVNLNSFGASTVDILVYTFTKTTNWVRYHEIKEVILLEIAKIIDNHGAEIAYPTQTLHINKTSQENVDI
jgi:MscS family membrane protein